MKLRWPMITVALVFVCPLAFGDLYYRDNLKLETSKVYASCFRYLEKSEKDKLKMALEALKPVADKINEQFNRDMMQVFSKAVQNGSPETIRKALYLFVFYDMKELFQYVTTDKITIPSIREEKYWISMAFQNYHLFLSPPVKQKNASVNEVIVKKFKEAYQISGSRFVQDKEQRIMKLLRDIEEACDNYFAYE